MSKRDRERYLRNQRARLARAREQRRAEPAAGSLADVVCEGCGLHYLVEMPRFGFELVVRYLDEDGVEHESRSTPEETAWLAPCPRCDQGGRVRNEQHGYDARGVRHDYFATTDAEKEAARKALKLVEGGQPISLDLVVSEMERGGGVLAELAAWVRSHVSSVPRVVLEVVLTLILSELLIGHGVTAEELDRLLEEHRLEHEEEPRESPEQERRRPGTDKPEPSARDGGDRRRRGEQSAPRQNPSGGRADD